MPYDFDQVIDRRTSDSIKWRQYGAGVLPLWVADMDFACPDAVIQALRARVSHGIFGYATEPPELRTVLVDRLLRLYDWQVHPEDLVFIPGVIAGFNLAIRAVTQPGDGVLAQTPVYYPILSAPANARCRLDQMQLSRGTDGSYGIDMEVFEQAILKDTRIFVLCNPHNPVGRAFERFELEQMASLCIKHDLVICSDEIHCDLTFTGHRHIPIAAIDPDISQRTITLLAPSKTFNLAGLHCSVAAIPNRELRRRFLAARSGLVPSTIGLLGATAALAAYSHGHSWLKAVLHYLEANRDYLDAFVRTRLPRVEMRSPEATYLAWLDCRAAGIEGNPHRFFLEKARVALNDGGSFGRGGEGFVRLNFGCPRKTLVEALERMEAALADNSTNGADPAS